MKNNFYIYILIAAVVTYLLRLIPMLLFKEEIKNNFVRSFIYYVPYATLAVMTFPGIMYDAQFRIAGIIALIVGTILAWRGGSLLKVAISCSVVVYVVELIIRMTM